MFGQTIGVWDGPGPADLLLAGASFDGGFVNARGDAVFVDGLSDELIFARDLTPETGISGYVRYGCLVLIAALRRYSAKRRRSL
jgi:hypothetical protein